jgi:hypothetical protein
MLATNNASFTNCKVVVTLKVLKKTDMDGFIPKKKVVTDFYYKYLINCAKVIDIQDLSGIRHYTTATITISGLKPSTITIIKGRYIRIKGYEYDKSVAFPVYKYRSGALNYSGYVSPKFTGAHYIYYNNGKIKEKIDYVMGKICTRNMFFQNAYNSKKSCMIYNRDTCVIEREYVYDVRENLICSNVFASNGTVLKQTSLDGQTKKSFYK